MSLRRFPIAAQRARNARIRETAERIARENSVADDARSIPVAVVPANTRETEPVPPTVRRAFLDRLQLSLHRIQDASVDGEGSAVAVADLVPLHDAVSDATSAAASSRAEAIASVLGRSCATCRGECCTAGGDHAFLREESLVRIRREHPALDDNALLAAYTSHIPIRHYRGSCLYHTTTGCALPRTLRSDLCNRYICGGLTQLTTALDATGGTTVFVGAADSVHLRRMALVDTDRTTPIALT